MAGNDLAGGRPVVKIDGKDLPESAATQIQLLVIDDHLHLPDQLTILWGDPDGDVFDRCKVKIGATVEVGVVATGRGASEGATLFQGEVTGLEGAYGVSGQRVSMRAYDLSHRLHRGVRTESYVDRKDSEIARKLASEAKIEIGSDLKDSGIVHRYVSQINLTDWEFLKARAREIGFETGVRDGKFFFCEPKVNVGAPGPGDYDATGALQLTFGADLLEFHPRVSGAAQVAEVYARGWSYLDKQAVVGHSNTNDCNSAPKIPITPGDVVAKFPTKAFVVTDRSLSTQTEADAAAAGAAHQASAALGEADGVARGNTEVRAGAAMSIAGVAPCFVGTWTVTNSRHVFDKAGYRTNFSVTGRQERSLLGLASVGATSGANSAGGPPVYGVVVGIVSNVKDPEGLSRIRLTFPWLSDDYETDWVRLVMPGAGESRGFVWLPAVDDEVLVAFEQGDVRRPYALGALYNGKDKWDIGTSQYDSSGRVTKRGVRSGAGHTLGFHEGPDKKGTFLRTGDRKLKIKMNETETKITIHSDGSVDITAREIMLDAQNSLELKAGSTLKLSAPQVSISGDATVDIDGGLITLN